MTDERRPPYRRDGLHHRIGRRPSTPSALLVRFVVRAGCACYAGLLASACAGPTPRPRPVPVQAPTVPAPEPGCCAEPPRRDFARGVAGRYRVAAIATRSFTPPDLWSALAPFVRAPVLRVATIGQSAEDRPIRAFTFGTGPVKVLLWSQMHGDESTATMALADLLAWFSDSAHLDEAVQDHELVRERIASALTVVLVPMLNPDGAARARRENAAGVDVNRDARRLATPEGRLLKTVHDSLRPAFGFNLHDQRAGPLTAPGGRDVAIALLAPPADDARTFGATRAAARLIAAGIASTLERDIPGRVARYDDAYEPRAFGELMQRGGTSTVLIESGTLPGDPEKQQLRTLNVVAIIAALDAIATGRYRAADPRRYDTLPRNGRAVGDGH